jgi:hypothetical protein
VGELLNLDSLKRVSQAYEAAEKVTECEGCEEGKISVRLGGGEYFIACPLLESKCWHGQALLARLNRYAFNGVFGVFLILGVPALFRDGLANPKPTTAIKGVNRWTYDLKTFLILHDEHGTGKSFAATFALYQLSRKSMLKNWKTPLSWTGLKGMWLSAYRATSRDEFYEAARTASFLILDDLGSEETTQRAKKRIADIVSERYNQKLPTVVTMNEDALRLANMYDDRTADRMIGAGQAVYCGGESMRLV